MNSNVTNTWLGAVGLGVIMLSAGAGCGGCGREEEKEEDPPPCTAGTTCDGNKSCETVAGSTNTVCTDAVYVQGSVVNETTAAAVEAATVFVLDATGAPATGPVVTPADGTFKVRVFVNRQSDGRPVSTSFTLRASAQGFLTFPSGVRRALPMDAADATQSNGEWLIQSELTLVELEPITATGLGSISGTVGTTGEVVRGGVLVTLAGPSEAPTGLTALSGPDGAFTVHNVPAGTYTVRGYRAGMQFTPATAVVVAAGQHVQNVSLPRVETPVGTVSGSINPVAGGCAAGTSVVLVPRETMPPGTTFPLTAVSATRGEVPLGLRAPESGPPSINSNWSIAGVPDGTYEVLAAWENDPDPCVFDPSGISGAFYVVEATMPGTGGSRDISIDAFKVTGAVLITGPGAADGIEDVTTLTPTFSWTAYSSSKNYQVAVFDSSGRRVFATTLCPDADSSCSTLSLVYGTAGGGTTQPATAPALQAGKVYQWRVIALGSGNGSTCGFEGIALSNDRECISISEDQRGLFRTPR